MIWGKEDISLAAGALRSEHDRERENQDQAIIRLISAQTSNQTGKFGKKHGKRGRKWIL